MAFNLADLFEAVAHAVPEREAVVAGSRRFRYAELDAMAARWATRFGERGVAAGDRVALMMRNGHAYIEALLGAFKARAVPVNVNHHYLAEELRHLLADADPLVVVSDPTAAPLAASVLGDRASAHLLVLDDAELADLQAAPAQPPRADRRGDDRYLLYTGGTTGLPKGVEWRHEDLFFAALGGGNRMGPPISSPEELTAHLSPVGTRVVVASPLMHGTAQWVALSTLLSGATLVIGPDGTFDPAALLDMLAHERAGQLVVVGDAFAVPLADALDAEADRWDLDALVVIASGGAALSPGPAARLLHHLPGAVVVDGYGASETGGQARRVLVPGANPPPRAGFVPEPGTSVLATDGAPLPPGSAEVGRIARRGRIPLGYRNDPERSAATFPRLGGQRWALSGDLGRVEADGTITLVGRAGRTINTGGEKVDALEVEDVIRSHPSVVDAMVTAVADDRFGEVIGAVVTVHAGCSLDLGDLAKHCQGSLARFKAPRCLAVVADLPRLPSGKPDFRRAAALLRGPE